MLFYHRRHKVITQWRLIICTCYLMVGATTLQSAPIADGCDKFLGNIVSGTPPANFADYWNQLTLENNGKWGNVEQTRDQMNWGSVSTAYTYAKSKGFTYKQHTFVWGTQAPGWLGGLSAAEQKAEVEEWIKAYGEKFPETGLIDVVNEPLNTPPAFKNALGGSGATGWDWVVTTFEMARKHCPKAHLLINEFEVEYDAKLAAEYLKIIMILKEKNLLDGIGIQCHTNEIQRDKPTVAAIREALDTLASSGLPIYISELDLKGDDSTQLADYKRLFPVFWEHPAVRGVTLWGYVPPTWVSGTELISNGNERPALKWLRDYVAGHKTAMTTRPVQKNTAAAPVGIDYAGKNSIRVRLAEAQNLSLRIVDLHGKTVFLTKNIAAVQGQSTVRLPAGSVAAGSYLVIVTGRRFIDTGKIAIVRECVKF